MGEVRFMISEAAKQVRVESHVLRYWEEELGLKIGRTEMGHRYYTKDDIQLFCCIKKLKDEGMLLKDLKPLIPELKATRLRLKKSLGEKTVAAGAKPGADTADTADTALSGAASARAVPADTAPSGAASARAVPADTAPSGAASAFAVPADTAPSGAASARAVPADTAQQAEVVTVTQLEQVRSLIGDVLTEVVADNNETLKKDISKAVTTDVIREMDFLFQAKERQEEEHFRKLDCLIRQQQASRRETAKGSPIVKLKKLFT